MKHLTPIIAVILLLSTLGCGSTRSRATVLYQHHADPHRRQPNLALGSARDHGRYAQRFNHRSDWPAVDNGYRYNDISSYTEYLYNEQYDYGRHGAIYSGRHSHRSGVLIR